MSVEYDFKGRLSYGSAADREAALEAARAQVAEDDAGLRAWVTEAWAELFCPVGSVDLVVAIEGSGPGDWWFSFEGMVETLCEAATAGSVVATVEECDGVERYEAGG